MGENTQSKKSIAKLSNFETLWDSVARTAVEFGEEDFANDLIEKYESLIENKEEEYIRLCHVKSYTHWFRQQFQDAVNICEEACYLLKRADQPDKFNIEHHQALAYRDSLNPDNIEKALAIFIKKYSEEEVLSTENLDKKGDGPMYGNVGKCYFLLNKVDDALTAYYKSFYNVFNDDSHNRLLNLGYAALWISEALERKSVLEPAMYFYRFAINSWEASSPVLVNRHKAFVKAHQSSSTYKSISSQESWRIEEFCLDWISTKIKVKF